MSKRFLTFVLIGLAVGIVFHWTLEYARFHAWDNLENEVDDWKRSPKGKWYGYLYGVDDTL